MQIHWSNITEHKKIKIKDKLAEKSKEKFKEKKTQKIKRKQTIRFTKRTLNKIIVDPRPDGGHVTKSKSQ